MFVVLDARLPPKLTQLSDLPEGSRSDPLVPTREVVGTIDGPDGPVDIVLDRVNRGASGSIWLFSSRTLAAVPALYNEVTLGWSERGLPPFLTSTRIGGVRLLEWVCVLLGLPILYFTTVVLNRILSPLISRLSRRVFRKSDLFARDALPVPVRLLLLALAIQWFPSILPAPLLVRQFWSNTASVITILAVVWLLILLNGRIEQYLRRNSPPDRPAGATALLRLGRRMVDGLVILAGLIAVIRLYGIDSTPALAGLGVGGIAVGLAAQKTLENVIAGTSLILDQAVRVGDVLKMGTVSGTVDHIGLRSTRLRTLDRTVVSVPNSQIANASLEILSARDKFWFHPIVCLRPDTRPEQLRAVVEGIRHLLETDPAVDAESIRVRFINLGPSSLDVDVFAYLVGPRLGPFPGTSGTAAVRRDGDRQSGGYGDRGPGADDTRGSAAGLTAGRGFDPGAIERFRDRRSVFRRPTFASANAPPGAGRPLARRITLPCGKRRAGGRRNMLRRSRKRNHLVGGSGCSDRYRGGGAPPGWGCCGGGRISKLPPSAR